MLSRINRPSPAMVLAIVAIVISCAGSATAATVITGKQIKNSSITSTDVKNASLLAKDFKKGQLKRGATGARGAAGPQGPAGRNGLNGAPGSARAYGTVAPDGSLTRSKGATVRKETSSGPGRYCITVPGVNPADVSPVATPDAGTTYYGPSPTTPPDAGFTYGQAFVEVRVGGGTCNSNEFEVLTGLQNFDSTNRTIVGQGTADAGFVFMVP